jgi:hypothetical protein
VRIVEINATSVGNVLKPAGLESGKGLINTNYGKEPLDSQWKGDSGMKRYFAFMEEYYPDGDNNSNFKTCGYSTAQLLVHVLKQCDDLMRESVMKQAASFKEVTGDLALPGISQHLVDGLPRPQAVADDEVQRRTLGAVRPNPDDADPPR